MAPVAHAEFGRVSLPLALPMEKDIDLIALDEYPLDREI